MNLGRIMFLGAILSILSHQAIHAHLFSSWFKSTSYEQTVHKRISVQSPTKLVLENLDGTITIKTESNKNTILVSALKKASDEDDLDEMEIVEDHKPGLITLTSKYDQKEIDGSIDYTLVVPVDLALDISTHDGDISIEQSRALVHASTKNGNIELFGPKNSVEVIARKTGSIIIHQPSDSVLATAARGNITIYDAQKSVIATADNGSIELHSKKVPSTSKLSLKTETGNIMVYLPHETNAELRAKTEKGTLFSDHLITVKPFTTTLNNKAWNKFKKEVSGTLGTGEAQIALHANQGSIKILERVSA